MGSTDWSKRLSNTKLKTTRSRKKLKPRTLWSTTATPSNNNLTMPSSKLSSPKTTKKSSVTLPTKLSNGSRATPTPNSKSTKPNKKKLRLSGTPSCREFTKKWVVNTEGCLEVECPEVCLVEWECQVGWEEECLSNHLRLPMLMKLTDPAEINIKFLKISIFLSVYMYLTNITK